MPSATYLEALATSNRQSARFLVAKDAYRAGKITSAEYCEAFAENKDSAAAFDAAWAAAQDVVVVVEAVVDDQLRLFA